MISAGAGILRAGFTLARFQATSQQLKYWAKRISTSTLANSTVVVTKFFLLKKYRGNTK